LGLRRDKGIRIHGATRNLLFLVRHGIPSRSLWTGGFHSLPICHIRLVAKQANETYRESM
jgi:hypothetical protein